MLSKESEMSDVVVVARISRRRTITGRLPPTSRAVSWQTLDARPSPARCRVLPVRLTASRSTLATADSRAVELPHGDLARPAEKIIGGAVIGVRRSARPSGFVRLHARARAR